MTAIQIHGDLNRPWNIIEKNPLTKSGKVIINCYTKTIRVRPEACPDFANTEFFQDKTMKMIDHRDLDESHKRRFKYFKRMINKGYKINFKPIDQQDKAIELLLKYYISQGDCPSTKLGEYPKIQR